MLLPRTSDEYCHSATPANHPHSEYALERASPMVAASTYPVPPLASVGVTGLPTTTLRWSTPLLTSSATAVPGCAPLDSMKMSV
jgi:hypothetical protein